MPLEPTWMDAPVMPLVVGRSNVQQSCFDFVFTWMFTTPCSPIPASRAPSSGCIDELHAAGTATARATTTAAGSASDLNGCLLGRLPPTVDPAPSATPLRIAETGVA